MAEPEHTMQNTPEAEDNSDYKNFVYNSVFDNQNRKNSIEA
jgi:hypothetical protein